MYIKKIIIGSIILIATGLTIKVMANRKLSLEQKAMKATEKIAQRLKLDEQQKSQVLQINLERAEGMKKAYEGGRKKEMAQATVAKWKEELSKILTSEQIKKMGL